MALAITDPETQLSSRLLRLAEAQCNDLDRSQTARDAQSDEHLAAEPNSSFHGMSGQVEWTS